ncbi:MAG: LamG domain-containing protein [Planctomycetota bacterium]|jgi:type II secretory pathway pseudopilin PulG
MRRSRRQQRGFSLLIVLMLVGIASTLGISYMSSSSIKSTSADNLTQAVRSRYLAEAGLEHAAWMLKTNPTSLPASPSGPFAIDATDDGYYFWGQATGEEGMYLLTGRGAVGSLVRDVSATVYIDNQYYELMTSMNPTCYWRMDDISGSTCRDVKGVRDGRYRNGPDLQVEGALSGSDNASVDFDGNNDYVDLDDFVMEGEALTLLAWVRRSDDSGSKPKGYVISKSTGPATNKHYWALSTYPKWGDIYLRFHLRTEGDVTQLSARSGALANEQWHLVAAVYDGETMRIYLDAQEVASVAKTGSIGDEDDDGNGNGNGNGNDDDDDDDGDGVSAWIGANPSNSNTRPFPGRLDEVAVFERALTPQELQSLYANQASALEMIEWHE